MSSWKLKRLFLFSFSLLHLLNPSVQAFTNRACFESQFKVEITHPDAPFGLLKTKLSVAKNGCQFTITQQKMKFLKKTWQVDICRVPIHIKEGDRSIDVYKRTQRCPFAITVQRPVVANLDPYCSEWADISQILADDGLIFAEGKKEDLKRPHGKIFCSYLLLMAYLHQGQTFGGNRPMPTLSRSIFASSTPAPLPLSAKRRPRDTSFATPTTPHPSQSQGQLQEREQDPPTALPSATPSPPDSTPAPASSPSSLEQDPSLKF